MTTEHVDEVPGGGPAPVDGAHDEVGALLDRIEADLDEVAAAVARMS